MKYNIQSVFDYFVDKLLDKILMGIFVWLCGFIGTSFTKLTDSVIELNSTMRLVVEDAKNTKTSVQALLPRVDSLEKDVLILKTKAQIAQEEK